MTETTDGQSGRTTKQMTDAPRGAIYVWPNRQFYYPFKLAEHLKRSDLVLSTPDLFDNGGYRLRGQAIPIILDHATVLNEDQQSALDLWRTLSEQKR